MAGIMISTVTLNPALDKTIYVDVLIPYDTNRITKVETDVGGKGINASRIFKELGDDTVAMGFVGGPTGRFIEHTLTVQGIDTNFVHVESDTRTNIAIQDASGAPPTMLNEAGAEATPDALDELFAKLRRIARASSMVLFGGSLPPGVPADIYAKLIDIVHEVGVKAILDADGEPMVHGMKAVPFMVKPNREEAQRLTGINIKSTDDCIQALDILGQSGIQLVVISMGSKGAVARWANGDVWLAIPPQVKPVSTIGSGDSMVAGIAHILSQDGSLEDAMKWGSAAGAATAMTNGTEIGRRSQVLELLDKVHVERLR